MTATYSDKMTRLENDYNSAIVRADEEYRLNNFSHCYQECVYLQDALNCRAKMIELSRGEEKIWQQRKADELMARLKTAILSWDPDYFKKKQQQHGSSGSSKKSQETQDLNPDTADTVSDQELASWKKPIPECSFGDVNGMDEVKQRLRACVKNANLEKAKQFLKMSPQKAYLLYGPPGCGKTFITKAFVHELTKGQENVSFFSVESAQILNSLLGETEKKVKRIFDTAIEYAPSVLFIDELDGLCKERSKAGIPEYASSLTTAFLTGYNRLQDSGKQIVFIGATNYVDNIDSAMRNRVEQVYIPYPDAVARAKKFETELVTGDGGRIPLTNGLTYDEMAAQTAETKTEDGKHLAWSYREIEHLCDNIRRLMLDRGIAKYGSEDAFISAVSAGFYGVDPELFRDAFAAVSVDDKTNYLES